MKEILIILWINAAMVAMGFWEAYVEGRNPWDKRKLGWKIKLGKYCFPAYHFYLFVVMIPLLLTLPFIIFGWNLKFFLIIAGAYSLGLVVEDFTWYLVNPKVKLKEFHTSFSDYFPWIKIKNKKIIPWGYLIGVIIAIFLFYFSWGLK